MSARPFVNGAHPQQATQLSQPNNYQSQVLKLQLKENQSRHLFPIKKFFKQTRSRLQVALIVMAFLVFGLGLLVNVQSLQANHSAKAQVAALAQQGNNSSNNPAVPSQTKPTSRAVSSYAVAPNLPKYLKIPKLDIDARVLQVGVTSSGALGTPPNIYDTAWYTGSAHPGDSGSNGAVLIDGHVHGPTLPGVFMNIKNLVPGDTILIVRGDNQVFTYKVVKVESFNANSINMGMMLASIQPGEPGLNLITCGGPFDTSTWQYTQRVAVFAIQV
jgi:LPXTG-site transpeptidase (sortase) family protein